MFTDDEKFVIRSAINFYMTAGLGLLKEGEMPEQAFQTTGNVAIMVLAKLEGEENNFN